ncbi:hypothetical protein D915_010698 [Fasciola hepatica]|uniref:Uncharacterized protein n=1 Tax=Fasciola hepatica TaxID=6192 RepID=A0A4E0QW09_FASHE|nr:hypothetical protein D915_010698 [Fasciola hepatica]
MTDEDESTDGSSSPYSDTSDISSIDNSKPHQGDHKRRNPKKAVQVSKTIKACHENSAIQVGVTQSVFAVGLTNGDIRVNTVSVHTHLTAIQLFRLCEESSHELVTRMKTNTETLPCTDIQFPAKETKTFGLNRFLLLASYASGFIRLWHYTASYLKSSLICQWEEKSEENTSIGMRKTNSNNQILCLSISYDGRRFVSGGTDTHIRVYSLASTVEGRVLEPCIRTDTAAGHTARITALAYHTRGKREKLYSHIFISAGWDDCIHIWNDQKAVSLWQYCGPHIAGSDGMDIDPVRNLILTCSWRFEHSMIQMWKFPEFVVDISKELDAQDREKYTYPVSQLSFVSHMRGSHVSLYYYNTLFLLNCYTFRNKQTH